MPQNQKSNISHIKLNRKQTEQKILSSRANQKQYAENEVIFTLRLHRKPSPHCRVRPKTLTGLCEQLKLLVSFWNRNDLGQAMTGPQATSPRVVAWPRSFDPKRKQTGKKINTAPRFEVTN